LVSEKIADEKSLDKELRALTKKENTILSKKEGIVRSKEEHLKALRAKESALKRQCEEEERRITGIEDKVKLGIQQ